MINRDFSCCFSGYRPEKLPWGEDESDPRCEALKDAIMSAVRKACLSGIRHYICGMARGSDLYFCEAVLLLRENSPDITFEAAIPYERQAANWPTDDRERYESFLETCDYITYVSRDYDKGCMLRRNRYMVDNSSLLLAVYDGKPGGTSYTVKYASRKGLEIILLDPVPRME